ncbi:MAG: hypothetical protein ACI9WU_000805, partial [Myxococcota bacterium]
MLPLITALTLSGSLTGDFADWGDVSIQALDRRDLAAAPIASTRVGSDGSFALELPEGTAKVYLTLWPAIGGTLPHLLRELPFDVGLPASIAVGAPPSERDVRHAMSAPTIALAAGLLAFLGLIVFGGRRWLDRRLARSDLPIERWIPEPLSRHSGGLVLWAIAASAGGLLLYGILALNEALDLLEYTYFQEAFSGPNPIAVALSPVVAERAHAPGYAVFLWAVTQFSRAEWVLRLPALASTVLGAFVLFRLTTEGTGSRKAGWIAALIATFTPLSMRYARDVTPYSLVGLLAILSTLLLYRAITRNQKRDWVGYVAVSVTAFFLHYFTAFLVIGQAAAGLWLFLRGGRGAFWTGRTRQALTAFGALGILPLLWSVQVIRAFIISEQDNLVTHAVYPEAPGFLTYCINHLRVLVGLPTELAWLVWPLTLLVVVGYVVLLRDKPAFGRLLLIPALMIVGLLITTYALHSYAYGGRIYYGWRWLRPYTAAVAIPVAYLLTRPMATAPRVAAWLGGALLIGATLFTGIASALTFERPAQRVAADTLMTHALDGDVIAVLPAAFYTPGLSFYLQGPDARQVHAGPSIWRYFPDRRGDYKRVFGPVRSFGIPLESLVGHVDISRLWVVVLREEIFGQPEFDPVLPDHVLTDLDSRLTRLKRWRMPHLDLVLYQAPPVVRPAEIRVDLKQLHRSLDWLPDAL